MISDMFLFIHAKTAQKAFLFLLAAAVLIVFTRKKTRLLQA
jgi:hypothetical protein